MCLTKYRKDKYIAEIIEARIARLEIPVNKAGIVINMIMAVSMYKGKEPKASLAPSKEPIGIMFVMAIRYVVSTKTVLGMNMEINEDKSNAVMGPEAEIKAVSNSVTLLYFFVSLGCLIIDIFVSSNPANFT